jgi:glucokinase
MVEGSSNDGAQVIAIDIGGGTTKLALVDRRGGMRGWRSFPTAGASGALFLETVADACCGLRAEANAPVAGISVAVAGFVGSDGSLDYNPNLPWLEKTPIAALLRDQTGLPVHVDADSNAACLAEYAAEDASGEERGVARLLCITGGTGIGVGMVIEGKLLRIARNCLGDAGHVIVLPEGPECSCGGRGCAEALLSTAALGMRYAGLRGAEGRGFRELVEGARDGVPAACELLEEAGGWMGVAAASLASIFLPDRIAIAGGLSRAGDGFFRAAQRSFAAHGGSLPRSLASLALARSGEHATLLGAAVGFFHPEMG